MKESRPQATSFHMKPVPASKYGSAQEHNKPEHRNTLNYIIHPLTKENESWYKDVRERPDKDTGEMKRYPYTLNNYLTATKKAVKEKTGRAMQTKAQERTIQDAVVVIDEHTTMDDLKKLGKRMEEEFGWTCLQIHIHRDEGHRRRKPYTEEENKSLKRNLHAHMFFNITNLETGKSWKGSKEDFSKIQDITADVLNLTRGKRNDQRETPIKHLGAVEYKIVKAEKEEEQLTRQIEGKRKEYGEAIKTIVSAKEALNEIAEKREILKQGKQILDSRLSQINDFEKNLPTIQEREIKPYLMDAFEKHEKWGGLKYDKEGFVNEVTQYMTNAGYAKKTEDIITSTKTDFQELETQNLRNQVKRLSEKNEQLTNHLDDIKNTLFKVFGNGFSKLFGDCFEWLKNGYKALKTALRLNNREKEWDDTNRVWLKANDNLDGLLINDTPLQEYKQAQNRTHVRGIRR